MKPASLVWALPLTLTLLWLAGLTQWPAGLWPWRHELLILTGLIGLGAMTLSLLLALRLPAQQRGTEQVGVCGRACGQHHLGQPGAGGQRARVGLVHLAFHRHLQRLRTRTAGRGRQQQAACEGRERAHQRACAW